MTQRFAGTDTAVQQMGELPPLTFKNRPEPVPGKVFLQELNELR